MTFNNIPEELRQTDSWVVWRYETKPDGKPTKVPYHATTGYPVAITADGTYSSLATAESAMHSGNYSGIGFAFTDADPFAGIDLDVAEGAAPSDIQQYTYNKLSSYSELSPSGRGVHIIVKGRVPSGRNSQSLGIELYSAGRFFTMTGNVVNAAPIADRNADINELWTELGSVFGNEAPDNYQIQCPVSVADTALLDKVLKSGKNSAYYNWTGQYDWSNAYRSVLGAFALFSTDEEQIRRLIDMSPMVTDAPSHGKESRASRVERLWAREYSYAQWKGDQERQDAPFRLWLGLWYGTGDCPPEDEARETYARVIGEARAAVARMDEAKRKAAEQRKSKPAFAMSFVTGNERAVKMEHLIDPWLPKRNVVGLYGRGEAGKSTWAATLCAQASDQVSTLWISSEEDEAHIALRHTHSGGQPNTLITLPANPTIHDEKTGKDVSTAFDVYSHLEEAILDFRKVEGYRADRPLGILVLDAINALVSWGKGENANDDASVKRMLSHLHTLAMTYDLSILILGHMNKNTSKVHGADAVTGSAAWTNSLRRAFMLYKDPISDDYEGSIRTAKGNTGTAFAASYKTVPVFTLLRRANGMDEVLCKSTITSEIVWGEKAIANLINDSDDEDPHKEKRDKRASKVKILSGHVAKCIQEGATTRDEIQAALPESIGKIYPKHWSGIDRLLQDSHSVDVLIGCHGKYEYRPRPQVQGRYTPATPLSLKG